MHLNVKKYSDEIVRAYISSGVSWHSDTQEQKLDLSKKQDSCEAIVLAILYAFTVSPSIAENALIYLKEIEILDFVKLSYEGEKLTMGGSDIDIVASIAPELVLALDKSYRRIPRHMAVAILRAAYKLRIKFDLDPREIYKNCDYDAVKVISELSSWKARLNIKSFWLAREMRTQKIWSTPSGIKIDGAVCCVVDVQVRRALEHLGYVLKGYSILEISTAIWNSYGELYDFPLLWFGREHCSNRPSVVNCPLGKECPTFSARLL